jgi:hypothetical protein
LLTPQKFTGCHDGNAEDKELEGINLNMGYKYNIS